MIALNALQFEDAETAKSAKYLVYASLVLGAMFIVAFIVDLIYFSSATGFDMSAFLLPEGIQLVVSLLIPVCGFVGAKQRNRILVLAAALCATCGALCGAIGIVMLVSILFLAGDFSVGVAGGEAYAFAGDGYLWYSLFLNVAFVVLYTMACYNGWNLSQKLHVQVVVVVQPHATVQAVPVQPQAVPEVKVVHT